MEQGNGEHADGRPVGHDDYMGGAMSLSEHLREVREDEEQRRHLTGRSLSPIPSTVDPIFSNNPYGLNESARLAESAKANAAKRDRELSATKRAAQNRAAQRAFRQRKEGHIQELEQQVNRYKALGEAHKSLQIENHQLRDYVATLQSSLIEIRGEVPPPPPGLELNGPRAALFVEDAEITRMPPPGPYTTRMASAAPSTATKRKGEPSIGTFPTTKTTNGRGAKRQQKEANNLPPFGPVTIGLRGADHVDPTNSQNIEPTLMNA